MDQLRRPSSPAANPGSYVYQAASNDFYQTTGNSLNAGGGNVAPGLITVDLSTVPGASNDPNFGVRLVSAYDSTGNLGQQYASAQLLSSGKTQPYNNSSGNWEFNFLSFGGNPGIVLPTLVTPANNVYWALNGGTASGSWDTSAPNWSTTAPPSDSVTYTNDGTYGGIFPTLAAASPRLRRLPAE